MPRIAKTICRRMQMQVLAATACIACLLSGEPTAVSAPVNIAMDRPGFATVVIEDAGGRRVANLIGEVFLPAGAHSFTWDLYDIGRWLRDPATKEFRFTRDLVKPGAYSVRGLTHTGIKPVYEFSVYSPGNTPWKTLDGTGAWQSDHCAPSDALVLPAGATPWNLRDPCLMLSAAGAESGNGTIFIEPSGRVLKAEHAGAKALARDVGSTPIPGFSMFSVGGAGGDTVELTGWKPDGTRERLLRWDGRGKTILDEWSFLALAVRNGLAVVSNSEGRDNVDDGQTGNLLVIDVAKRAILANHSTAPSRGVAFAADGSLLACLGPELHRYTVDPATGALGGKSVLQKGFAEPRRLLVSAAGEIYVSEWAAKHQILVFDRTGKPLRTIGKAGGPQIGPYDEQRMDRPEGMAIIGGELWVAENSHIPKRHSRWRTDGSFISAIYGRPQYGGGGVIDPVDKSVFWYPHTFAPSGSGGLRWRLNWATGTARLESIYYRAPIPDRAQCRSWDGIRQRVLAPFMDCDRVDSVPYRPIHLQGRTYLWGDNPQMESNRWSLWLVDGAVVRPVAAFGSKYDLRKNGGWQNGLADADAITAAAAGKFSHWVWTDDNHDRRVQAVEMQFFEAEGPGLSSLLFQADLSVIHGSLASGRLACLGIDAAGIPRYDVKQVARLAQLPESGIRAVDTGEVGHPVAYATDGRLVITPAGWGSNGWNASPFQGYRDGSLQWTYRHYGQNTIAQFPGQVVSGPGRIGPAFTPRSGEAGELFCTTGNTGAVQLFTTDGLFLKRLGADMRTAPLWRMPEAKRGMVIDGVSWEDEDFYPSLTQVADGTVYVVAGKEHSSILRLDGFDSVRRQKWTTINVTPAMLAGLPAHVVEKLRTQGRQELDCFLFAQPPVVDGRLQEWNVPEAAWATLDNRTRATLAISGERLYVAFRTGDASLLENSAKDWRFAFKHGGALDLMIGSKRLEDKSVTAGPGDCRLLVTLIRGKPTAVLYRQVAPDAPAGETVLFESPIGKETFASVRDVSAGLELGGVGGDWEFSIPLATLGVDVKPKAGQQLTGDLGIIRGDGQQNTQRLYWNNLDVAIVSDIPSEVRLRPQNWGSFCLRDGNTVLDKELAAVAAPAKTAGGLDWRCWELTGEVHKLQLTAAVYDSLGAPVKSGTCVKPSEAVRTRDGAYALRFNGLLEATLGGWYQFGIKRRDSHVRLLIDGQEVANQDVGSWVRLAKGLHAVDVLVRHENPQHPKEFAIAWQTPAMDALTVIPESAFLRALP